MADDTAVTRTADRLEADVREFMAIRTALRDAIKAYANVHGLETPVRPQQVIAALLGEASSATLLWGLAQGRQPQDIEEWFEHACRNARRALKVEIASLQAAQAGRN